MIDIHDDRRWDWYVAHASAVKLMTNGTVWLHTSYGRTFDPEMFPWHLPIEKIEASGTWYGSIPSGVRFEAQHESGLKFVWCVDFYGSSSDYAVDAATLSSVWNKLRESDKPRLREALGEMSRGLIKYRNDALTEVKRREDSLRVLADYGVS